MREPEFYRQLARTIERDESIPHEELIGFLAGAGYEKQVTCEMPGQFAVRGGIIDVFSPEAPQPVRIELLGDTIESIRAFDPNTQRSTNPVERATLLPLTEFPAPRGGSASVQRVASASGREDDAIAARAFIPAGNFARFCAKSATRCCSIWPAIRCWCSTSPSLLEAPWKNIAQRLARGFRRSGGPARRAARALHLQRRRMVARAAAFPAAGARAPRASRQEGAAALHASRCRRSPPRAITATWPLSWPKCAAGSRGRARDGFRRQHGRTRALRRHLPRIRTALPSRRTRGERHRHAPGRRGKQQRQHAGDGAGEGAAGRRRRCFPKRSSSSMATPICSKRCPPPQRPRSRPKTASFFSDFSDLKPGDYVVHVDHGIGQFEGLRQVGVEGATGEFMLLRYAGDARLYVPLARLDLVQKYQSLGGVEADARPAWARRSGKRARRACANPSTTWPKSFSRFTPSARPPPATPFPPIRIGSANSKTPSNSRKLPTSCAPSKT